MGYQKIYSKSSQKHGIRLGSTRSCTEASAASFSRTQYCSAMRQDCTARVWWNVPIWESFFFGFLNDVLVTVEEFIDGHFAKYINGDGKCKTLPLGDMKHAYQKAQPLVYCSYKLSKRKFMLLDIRENMNNL